MIPALDRVDTVLVFVAVVAAGIAGLYALPVGIPNVIVLFFVLPAMLVYGAIMVLVGVGYGKYRAANQ